jgi:poly-gamma-glutamate capsule biosynthesis protein CapA/YwtB (metallophosphatase superfamily)
MDFGEAGLLETIAFLDRAGILYVGAGKNLEEALKPVIVSLGQTRIAFISRSAVIVSSKTHAETSCAGIAPFDLREAIDTITACKKKAGIVILLIHWGMENYSFPSPEQRLWATKIVEAGADAILGHHPHVLQGIERIGSALVAYSLGNFLFDDFTCEIHTSHSLTESDIRLSLENKKGLALTISFDEKNAATFEPTFSIIGENGKIYLDQNSDRVPNFEALCKRLTWPLYARRWKLYSLKREWDLRIKPKVFPRGFLRKLLKVRPQHFIELFNTIRRSSKITSGKSTNPYE